MTFYKTKPQMDREIALEAVDIATVTGKQTFIRCRAERITVNPGASVEDVLRSMQVSNDYQQALTEFAEMLEASN